LINADQLITHTFGFEDAKKTMEAVIDGTEPIIKAVMTPNK